MIVRKQHDDLDIGGFFLCVSAQRIFQHATLKVAPLQHQCSNPIRPQREGFDASQLRGDKAMRPLKLSCGDGGGAALLTASR